MRHLLLTYYDLLDAVRVMRTEMASDGTPLGERVAAAGIESDLLAGIEAANNWLRREAKRGGRGVPPLIEMQP